MKEKKSKKGMIYASFDGGKKYYEIGPLEAFVFSTNSAAENQAKIDQLHNKLKMAYNGDLEKFESAIKKAKKESEESILTYRQALMKILFWIDVEKGNVP